MKARYRLLCFILCALIVGNVCFGVEFASHSRLAEGNWVKIKTGETGLYVIPYSELREMGFSSPDRVGVYGKGGEMLSFNFKESVAGHPYYDDLRQTAVIHKCDSLLFYAQGTDKIIWDNDEDRFIRKSKNIYSDYGVYFLSDIADPELARNLTSDAVMNTVLQQGKDYMFHEKDLCHNVTGTGQQFWGEEFKNYGGTIKWDLPARYAVDGDVDLEYAFYIAPSLSEKVPYSIGMSVKESGEYYSASYNAKISDAFTPRNYTHTFDVKPENRFEVSLGVQADKSDFSRLDYWLLTYPKRFPVNSMELISPERYVVRNDSKGAYSLNLPGDINVVDVTSPERIGVSFASDGNTDISLRCLSSERDGWNELVFYSSQSELGRITEWKPVVNSDIHGFNPSDVEFAIITVPRFVDYARQIASIHKEYDGIETIVATPEEIYNEFSGGVPDPQAYRAFMRMVYDRSDGRLKNLLLLGPSLADIRALKSEPDTDYIIAYQEPEATSERPAACVYDIYGILADEINPARLNREKMEIGVGLLSCFDDSDCQRAVRKIRRYMKDQDKFFRYLNETFQIGGLHNVHAHDKQAVRYGILLSELAPAPVAAHNLSIDAFGNVPARKRFFAELNAGKIMTTYFGHGGVRFMGMDGNFFTTSDMSLLKNRFMGFAFLGGCDFSFPDRRIRGLGESFVLDSENGMIGGIISCRTSMSSVNYELAKRIATEWMASEYGAPSPTAGEFYAKVKSNSSYRNSLNYFYSGDPAIRFPVASQHITVSVDSSVLPGMKTVLKGKVENVGGNADIKFNGKAVLKIARPAVTLQSMDYVTGTYKDTSDPDTLYVDYRAEHLLSFEFEIVNGEFSTEIILPLFISKYQGKLLPLYISAFDNENRTGAVGYIEISIGSGSDLDENNPVMDDREAPSIEAVYDHISGRIGITCRDNVGLYDTGSVTGALLDGKKITLVPRDVYDLKSVVKSAEYFYDAWELSSGSHMLEITVSDVSGNSSELRYDFDVPDKDDAISMTLSSEAVVDELIITAGEITGTVLIIRDSEGNEILRRPLSGSYVWNCEDNNGENVAPGLYSVCIVENVEGIHKRFSGWRNVAVLK